MLSRFDTVPERDRQTDRQTDRIAVSISRVSIIAAAVFICMTMNTTLNGLLYVTIWRRYTMILRHSGPKVIRSVIHYTCYDTPALDARKN